MKKKLVIEWVRVIVERRYPDERDKDSVPTTYQEVIMDARLLDDEQVLSAHALRKIRDAREKNGKRGRERFGY